MGAYGVVAYSIFHAMITNDFSEHESFLTAMRFIFQDSSLSREHKDKLIKYIMAKLKKLELQRFITRQ